MSVVSFSGPVLLGAQGPAVAGSQCDVPGHAAFGRLLDDRGTERFEPVGEDDAETLLQIGFTFTEDGLVLGDRPRHRVGDDDLVAGSELAAGEQVGEVAFGGRAGGAGHVVQGGIRQQAAFTGELALVAAGAVLDHRPCPAQQVPDRGRVGEVGEVSGSAGDDVVQQQPGDLVTLAVASVRSALRPGPHRLETGGQSKILAPIPFRRQPHLRWWGAAHVGTPKAKLGVQWSQVQILSARRALAQVKVHFWL